ncbi:hypothetical protein GGTG_14254 [Gaeumannomyces tritici R3-111a-1]|uniref:JmjC domain-containing protein n=1 Tax=Gaeumannomyces tritici (strain R3-111a-1) TaxID=644352 RepID=J3PL17_GAET3|nr:hypothetical protein GGTG_14254 [Gaeumannomyces tritici R3-111a-1]EJT68169.1 hypothetical protein GGTG_14254 [Gaeumannomyces tritici R3-111a-1]
MHCEDARWFSINVNGFGWKIWILLSQKDTATFEKYIRKRWGDGICDDQWVRHHSLFISPKELRRAGINFDLVVAGPGDAVVTARGQYHEVVNMTSSLAVAINFQLPSEPIFPGSTWRVCQECGLYALGDNEGRDVLKRVEPSPPPSPPSSPNDDCEETEHVDSGLSKQTATLSASAPARVSPKDKGRRAAGKPESARQGHNNTHQSKRKRSTGGSSARRTQENSSCQPEEPPQDRRPAKLRKDTPDLRELANEIIGPHARMRLRGHIITLVNIATERKSLVLGSDSVLPDDWAKQLDHYYSLSQQWEKYEAFSGMVASIFATKAVMVMYDKLFPGKTIFNDDGKLKSFPGNHADKFAAQFNISPLSFRTWKAQKGNLIWLGMDFIPLLPSVRVFQRLSKTELTELLGYLSRGGAGTR